MRLRVLWLGLKAVLSLALLSGAAWLMVKATPHIAEQPEALGISAVLLFSWGCTGLSGWDGTSSRPSS